MQTLLFFVVLCIDECMVTSKVFHWILIFCVLSWVSYIGISKDGGFCNVQHIFFCPSNWGQVSLCLSHFYFLTVLFDTLKAKQFCLILWKPFIFHCYFCLEQADSHCVVCVILWDILNPLQVSRLCLLVFVMNIFHLIFLLYFYLYHTIWNQNMGVVDSLPNHKDYLHHNTLCSCFLCQDYNLQDVDCLLLHVVLTPYICPMHTFFYKEMHINVC